MDYLLVERIFWIYICLTKKFQGYIMRRVAFILGLVLSANSFAGIVPRVNCVGSSYDRSVLKNEEVQEDKVLLEYRSGGAAFANVFYGELKDYTFIALINKSYPITNTEALPLNLGIYGSNNEKVLAEKPVILSAFGVVSKVEVKTTSGKILTLSCSRLLNP